MSVRAVERALVQEWNKEFFYRRRNPKETSDDVVDRLEQLTNDLKKLSRYLEENDAR